MSDPKQEFQKQQAAELAHFIVGCLVFEAILKIDHEALNHQNDAVKHSNQRGNLEAATRIVARCLEGRLAEELNGLPFDW